MSHSGETDHSSLLDRKVLEDLRKLSVSGHANYLDKAISLFEKNAPPLVKSIHETIARNDAKGLRFAAHSLKSSSALLGATELSSLCLKLENMGRKDSMHEAPLICSDLDKEFEVVLRALEQEKSENRLGESV